MQSMVPGRVGVWDSLLLYIIIKRSPGSMNSLPMQSGTDPEPSLLRTANMQSTAAFSLRKEISLPSLVVHPTEKQLSSCKSWNELARETQEKKQKRKLNNQLKCELEKFFDADEILLQLDRNHRGKSQRSNKRMSTSKGELKHSFDRNSNQTLSRQNRPSPIKMQSPQNFASRKGPRPTKKLADLDIPDGNYQTFKLLVPQSPVTYSSGQPSTPKQTPKSQIIPCKLANQTRYTQPDSPVDRLDNLRTHTSPNECLNDKNQNQLVRHNSVYLENENQWNYLRGQTPLDELQVPSSVDDQQRINEISNSLQKKLGLKRADSFQNPVPELQLIMSQGDIQYNLARPQLQIIDEVDEKSFSQRVPREEQEVYYSIPLSVVEEKPQSELQDYKLSDDMIPLRYSIDIGPQSFQDQQFLSSHLRGTSGQIIKHCSSKDLFKNHDMNDYNEPLTDTRFPFTNSFKKEINSHPIDSISGSSSKIKDEYPTIQVIPSSNPKGRTTLQEQIDMSPIERSKTSYAIPDLVDNSISKDFGFDLFTPKNYFEDQSIGKLSPILESTQQGKEIRPSKFHREHSNFPSLDKLVNPSQSLTHLTIKYHQATRLLETPSQHTLKVTKKSPILQNSSSLTNKRGSSNRLDLKEFTYNNPAIGLNSPPTFGQFVFTEPICDVDSIGQASKTENTPVNNTNKPYLRLNTYNDNKLTQLPHLPALFNYIQRPDSGFYPPLNQTTKFESGSTRMTPFTTPLVSQRPSNNRVFQSQRQSTSVKKRKGISLWVNNYQEGAPRSKSPIEQRLRNLKHKKSQQRLNKLDSGIFKSRSHKNTDSRYQSPMNSGRKVKISTFTASRQDKSPAESPGHKRMVQLGNNIGARSQSPKKGIKLSCEFKKHKYQKEGVIRHIG